METRDTSTDEIELDALLKRAARDVTLTEAAGFFCAQATQAMDLLNHLVRLTEMCDNAAEAYWSIDGRGCPPEKKGWYRGYLQARWGTLIEMVLCRVTDSFLSYLSESVRLVLRSRPEVLKTSATIRVDYALSFNSLNDLVHDLVEKKVMELGYGGFQELNDWCSKRLGEYIVLDDQQLQKVVELIETRNLIVHNRSRVGPKYLDRVPNSGFCLGDLRNPTVEYLFSAYATLVDVAKSYDTRVAVKFGLAQNPVVTADNCGSKTAEPVAAPDTAR